MPAAPAGADYTALLYPKTRRPVKERRFTPLRQTAQTRLTRDGSFVHKIRLQKKI